MKGLKVFLDNSLEIGIAVARIVSVVAVLGAVVAGIATIWASGDTIERWGATVVLLLAVAGAAGWVGWWHFGNNNWKAGRVVMPGWPDAAYRQGGPVKPDA